ncbi:hypothetical protein HU200_022551 [Digitaria exilis]|uniref:F-box domain-containing protein n=1 Tax=Digitaria exilis TaxID=1010633 RepID=A0A835CAC1_9POAL|nr:hypothetical protein HU200_022551 [Digitaria exilis]
MDLSGSKKRASAATAAADLTDDLIVEILSRLPVKSICRFKCVSRHWRGLISDPAHRKKLPQTLSGFFYPRYYRLDDARKMVCPGFWTGYRAAGFLYIYSGVTRKMVGVMRLCQSNQEVYL